MTSEYQFRAVVEEIKEELTDPDDGPVTQFVAICRAIRFARKDRYAEDALAEALHEVLPTLSTEAGNSAHNTADGFHGSVNLDLSF